MLFGRLLVAGVGILVVVGGLAVAAPVPTIVQLWLVRTYPDYFVTPFAEWSTSHSLPEQLLVRAIAAKSLLQWQQAEVNAIEAQTADPRQRMKVAAQRMERITLSQLEVLHQAIDQPAFARLVVGMSWCDGLNHLLYLIVRHFTEGADLYYLWDTDRQQSPHTLVQVQQDGGAFFLDILTGPQVFTFDDPDSFRTVDVDSAEAALSSYESVGLSHPEALFEDGGAWSAGIPTVRTPALGNAESMPKPAAITTGAALVPYLEARVLMLIGDLVAADAHLREALVACSDSSDPVCLAAAAFLSIRR